MAKLCVEGNRGFETLCQELDIPYKKTGKLLVAFDETDMDALRSIMQQGIRNGCEGLRLVGAEEMEKLAPGIGGIGGMSADQILELEENGRYNPRAIYDFDQGLHRVIDQLVDGTFARQSGNFESVHDELMIRNDEYYVCRDFHDYVQAWEELTAGYTDTRTWNRISIHNTAKSGYFSSDRTIREYASDIWHITEQE